MTVKELIEELQLYDPNLPVNLFANYSDEPNKIKVVKEGASIYESVSILLVPDIK